MSTKKSAPLLRAALAMRAKSMTREYALAPARHFGFVLGGEAVFRRSRFVRCPWRTP